MAIKTRKVKVSVGTKRGRGNNDPKWTGWESMSGQEYHKHRRDSVEYYYREYKTSDLLADVYAWMKENKYGANDIKAVKTHGSSGLTQCAIIARCLRTGMPDYNKAEDDYWQTLAGTMGSVRPASEYLRERIAELIETGRDKIVEEVPVEDKPTTRTPTIQERLRDAAMAMTEEIEEAFDSFSTDPDAFEPKKFKVQSLLRSKEAKAAHARIIRDFYKPQMEEYDELINNPCEQLKEGYGHLSKKNQRKLYDFTHEVISACEMLMQEAKVNKKPRARKAKPVEKIVGKLKYAKANDQLKLVSINPADIVGAKELWVFNVKTRKLGKYVAADFQELGVKGTTITGFSESLSVQKTLRKPEEQLTEFKKAGKVQLRKFLEDIKAVDIKLNGRCNEDTVLLKVS